MEMMKDLYYTNKSVWEKALKATIKNWTIIFTGVFYFLATLVIFSVLRFFWILGGLVLIITTSALISNYLYLLSCVINRGEFNFQDFKDGFMVYLRKVWGILFIGWVASMVIDLLIFPLTRTLIHPMAFQTIISFLTFILFNPLPEVVYQKTHYYNPWESVTYTIDFAKNNWIEWFVPNIILLGVLYLLTGTQLTGIFNYYSPIITIFNSSKGVVFYILGQALFSFIMIYRGFLFQLLSTSSRRKRLFMREF